MEDLDLNPILQTIASGFVALVVTWLSLRHAARTRRHDRAPAFARDRFSGDRRPVSIAATSWLPKYLATGATMKVNIPTIPRPGQSCACCTAAVRGTVGESAPYRRL